MARKRHLASSARGLFGLCLMTQIEVQEVQEVQWVQEVQKVQEDQWVQIRPIRGRKSSGVLPSRQRLLTGLYPRALPSVTHSSAFQAPECMWGTIRSRIQSRGQVFISVYRLAIDAEPERVMMWLTENV